MDVKYAVCRTAVFDGEYTILTLYEQILQGIGKDARRELQSEILAIKSQISTKRKQIEQVEDMMITDRTNAER